MTKESIQVIMVWPGEHPCMTELLNDRNFLDFAVGLGSDLGGEAAVMKLSGTAAILYNSEGLISELRGNRKVGSKLLVGVFYIVGVKNGKLSSLSFDEMEMYFERFWEPEYFSKAEVNDACFADIRNDIEDLAKRSANASC